MLGHVLLVLGIIVLVVGTLLELRMFMAAITAVLAGFHLVVLRIVTLMTWKPPIGDPTWVRDFAVFNFKWFVIWCLFTLTFMLISWVKRL